MNLIFWLAGVVTVFLLVIACSILLYYRKKRKCETIYQVKIHSEERSLSLITYQDTDGVKKDWVYDKIWEKTVFIPADQQPSLMVSARYLDRTESPGEIKERPLVTGKIISRGIVINKEQQDLLDITFSK